MAKEKATKKTTKKSTKKAKSSKKSVNKEGRPLATEAAKWYVVNTYSGHEKKVAKLVEQRVDASEMRDKVFEILVPVRNVITVKDGEQKIKEEQVYPGYIFVHMEMNDETWYLIRNTDGVTGFIGTDKEAKPVDEKEVEGIKKLLQVEEPEFDSDFKVGDAVKIKSGAFADFMGTVQKINQAKGQITVLISIFGRETPVDLDFTDVDKL